MRYRPFLAGYIGEDLTNSAGLWMPQLAARPERGEWFRHPVRVSSGGVAGTVRSGDFTFQDTIALAWRIKSLRFQGSLSSDLGSDSFDFSMAVSFQEGANPDGTLILTPMVNESEYLDPNLDPLRPNRILVLGHRDSGPSNPRAVFGLNPHNVLRRQDDTSPGFTPTYSLELTHSGFAPGIGFLSVSVSSQDIIHDPSLPSGGTCTLSYNSSDGAAREIDLRMQNGTNLGRMATGSITITATEYWTYAKSDGTSPIFDASTGVLIPGANPFDMSI